MKYFFSFLVFSFFVPNFAQAQIKNNSVDSIINKDYLEYSSLISKNDSIRKQLSQLYNNFYSKNQNQSSKIYINKIDSIDFLLKKNQEEQLLLNLKYVKKIPYNEEILGKIYLQLNRDVGRKYIDEISNITNDINENNKNSVIGLKIHEIIKGIKNSEVGQIAPNIIGKSVDDKEVSLFFYRNKKYILLDFWATWCLPCREDFSFLKILHEKYNSKGFEIISISKDEKIDLWKKIILKDSIQDWIHYSVKLNNTDVEKKYAVTAIPVKILIDLDGKIIGRWKGGGDENKSEIEKALNDIFKLHE